MDCLSWFACTRRKIMALKIGATNAKHDMFNLHSSWYHIGWVCKKLSKTSFVGKILPWTGYIFSQISLTRNQFIVSVKFKFLYMACLEKKQLNCKAALLRDVRGEFGGEMETTILNRSTKSRQNNWKSRRSQFQMTTKSLLSNLGVTTAFSSSH